MRGFQAPESGILLLAVLALLVLFNPFSDGLLALALRDELDVRDIPIARLTDEFLSYVRLLEEIDLDAAADFIFLAAELIGIKARMLLPRPADGNTEAWDDPRRSLVERLLEYVRYKEVAGLLEARAEDRGQHFARGIPGEEASPAAGHADGALRVSLFDLMSALRAVLAREPEALPAPHALHREEWSVDDQIDWLRLHAAAAPVAFTALVRGRSRAFIIATFLAVLELVRRQALVLRGGVGPEDFSLQIVAPEAGGRLAG